MVNGCGVVEEEEHVCKHSVKVSKDIHELTILKVQFDRILSGQTCRTMTHLISQLFLTDIGIFLDNLILDTGLNRFLQSIN